MFTVEWFFCPDGITPNSNLTGPNNTIYIYKEFSYSIEPNEKESQETTTHKM